MTDLSLFAYSTAIPIRFGDMDALQHVNHAMYLTYMETARIEYMRDVLQWSGDMGELSLIVARIECDYKLPLTLEDKIAEVHIRASRLGNSSFDLDYLLTRGSDGAVVAEAKTVMVVFDYHGGASMPIPDFWREKMTAFEPGL